MTEADGEALRHAWLQGAEGAAEEYHDFLVDMGVADAAGLMAVRSMLTAAKGCGRFMYSCGESCATTHEELLEYGCNDCKEYAALKLSERDLLWGSRLEWRP